MRALARSLGRCLALLLVLEFADVPITCADQWSSKSTARGLEQAVDCITPESSLGAASAQIVNPDNEGGLPCYCPCHLTFQSASRCWILPPAESIELHVSSNFLRAPLSSRSLDHPPQN